MNKSVKIAIGTLGTVVVAGALSIAALAHSQGTRMKGYVTDTWCGVNRDTKAPSVECTNECIRTKGAKFAFYNFADKKVYILNPQTLAAGYAGQQVVLRGTIGKQLQQFATMRGSSEGQVITASSISTSSWHW